MVVLEVVAVLLMTGGGGGGGGFDASAVNSCSYGNRVLAEILLLSPFLFAAKVGEAELHVHG